MSSSESMYLLESPVSRWNIKVLSRNVAQAEDCEADGGEGQKADDDLLQNRTDAEPPWVPCHNDCRHVADTRFQLAQIAKPAWQQTGPPRGSSYARAILRTASHVARHGS